MRNGALLASQVLVQKWGRDSTPKSSKSGRLDNDLRQHVRHGEPRPMNSICGEAGYMHSYLLIASIFQKRTELHRARPPLGCCFVRHSTHKAWGNLFGRGFS
jgi:hypothetical protein